MDPNAAWVSYCDAMCDRDRAAVAETTGILIGWVERGGFIPEDADESDPHHFLKHMREIRAVAEMS